MVYLKKREPEDLLIRGKCNLDSCISFLRGEKLVALLSVLEMLPIVKAVSDFVGECITGN